MKHIMKMLLFATMTCFFAGCDKIDDLPYYEAGAAPTLTVTPLIVAPGLADSNNVVLTANWTSPNYATDSTKVKYILEIDSTGRNFATSTKKEVTGTRTASFTGRELNAILLNYGFALGVAHKFDVRITSSYGNNNARLTSNVATVSITPFTDPSEFFSSATTSAGTLATASQKSLTFSWTSSFTGYTGAVTYTIQYDSAGKNFSSSQELAAGTGVFSKDMTHGEMNSSATSEGVVMGTTGKIEYRIKATTAGGAVSYSNAVAVTVQTYIAILRFYMPGSYQASTGQGRDWTPEEAPEFIRDLRTGLSNKLYYMYMFLPAGAEFKVTQGRSWSINYGGSTSSSGDLSSSGGNMTVSTAGVYRISIDVVTMKYDIRAGRMGFVGGATGAGWNPNQVFPNYSLGLAATNLFVGLTNFTTDEWKLIDNDQWNSGSNTLDETRTYGSAGPSGSTVIVNGPNFPAPATSGRYRVMWDGRDPDNVKYEMYAATEMRVVGNGINQAGVNEWDPPTSPNMTYAGNGIWTITLNLRANKEIKFLAGSAWGAFDYEDNSGGSTSVGTPRKIRWDNNGGNFMTPTTAGIYIIELNENAQTVTIRQ